MRPQWHGTEAHAGRDGGRSHGRAVAGARVVAGAPGAQARPGVEERDVMDGEAGAGAEVQHHRRPVAGRGPRLGIVPRRSKVEADADIRTGPRAVRQNERIRLETKKKK